jgi:cell division protein FtsQ
LASIETVDTRYPNGYAITWKPGTNIDWKAVIARTKPDLNAY